MQRTPGQICSLIWHKSVADLMAESARAMLGILWWVVEPILYMAVFYFVFSVGFRSGGNDFVAFLLTGLVAWKWFQSCIGSSTMALVGNQGLMSQVYLPKWSLVAMVVLTNTFKFVFVLVLFFVYLMLSGYRPSLTWFYIVPMLLSLLVLICGLASVSAFTACFIPEVKLVVDNGLMLLFFISGIFFDISAREAGVRETLLLNPLAGWIINFRQVLLHGMPPDFTNLLVVLACGLVSLVIGLTLLHRFDRLIAKVSI